MTTRRWMIVAAIVALFCWGGSRARALERRAVFHAVEEAACLLEAQRAEAAYQSKTKWAPDWCGPRSHLIEIQEDFAAATELRERADYHAQMEAKYRRAADYFWINVAPEKPFAPDDRGRSPGWLRARAEAYESLEKARRQVAASAEAQGTTEWATQEIRRAERHAQVASDYRRRAALAERRDATHR